MEQIGEKTRGDNKISGALRPFAKSTGGQRIYFYRLFFENITAFDERSILWRLTYADVIFLSPA